MHRLQAALRDLRSFRIPILFVGLVYLAIAMMWTLYSAYVPVFLDVDFGLKAAAIGIVMMLDNLASLLIQPWIGARSDRLRAPLGRRMPIILASAPFAAAGFALIPATAALGGLPAFMLTVSVMLVAMAAIRVPLFALMPDLTPPARQGTANGLLNLFGGLGTLIGALGMGGLYRSNRATPFWLAGALLILAALLLLVVLWRMAPEQLRSAPPHDQVEEETTGAIGTLRETLTSGGRNALLLLLSVFFYTFGFNAIESFFSLYGRTQLEIREEQALALVGTFFLAYLLASVPAGMLGERVGRRRLMVAGLLGMSVLLGLAYLGGTLSLFQVAMPLGGLAWALVNSNALPAVVQTAPAARAGTAIGLLYSATTLASILSPPLNGALVDLNGGNYGLIVLTASVAAGLGALCLLAIRFRR